MAVRARLSALPPVSALALTLPAGLLAGWLFTSRPMLVELPTAAIVLSPLLISPRMRVLFLVFGTIFVFGPSQLNHTKLLFLFGATVAFVGAFQRSRTLTQTSAFRDMRPLFRASIVLAALVVVSLAVAKSNGVTNKEWLRDVAPYVMFTWAPLFAFDAQSALKARELRRLLVLAGVAGGVTFTVHWLTIRGIAHLSSSVVGLPTFLLSGALFSFAISMVVERSRKRLRWLAMASLVLGMAAATGTRASFVLLAAPIAIIIGTRRHLMTRSIRLAIALPVAALLVAVSAESLIKLTHANQSVITQRVDLLFRSGKSTDQSYKARLNQASAAWKLFRSSPLTGVGPGYSIQWNDAEGGQNATPTVDTPLGFLSDYGILGLGAVIFLAASFISTLRRLRRRTAERTQSQLALIGYAAVIVAWSILEVPFEDKGLIPGILLLVAIAVRESTSGNLNLLHPPER